MRSPVEMVARSAVVEVSSLARETLRGSRVRGLADWRRDWSAAVFGAEASEHLESALAGGFAFF